MLFLIVEGIIFNCGVDHFFCGSKGWGSFVPKHGVTGQRCHSDPDPDFVCTSTWLAAHYFSSLRQCMTAALV